MKIIDCFIFYNEIEMLKYRLSIIGDYIDYFILVESKKTFTNRDKILYYQEYKNDPIIKKYESKIIQISLNELKNEGKTKDEIWENEYYQRNMIHKGIEYLNLNKEDIIIISDVDEIINPLWLVLIKNKKIYIEKLIYGFEMDFYYYNLNYLKKNKWYFVKFLNYETYILNGNSPQNIRMLQAQIYYKRGGWHLSYFGNEEYISNKIQNFSHQEYNKMDYIDKKNINERIKNGEDLFNRENEELIKISITDNNNLPPLYYEYLFNYFHF